MDQTENDQTENVCHKALPDTIKKFLGVHEIHVSSWVFFIMHEIHATGPASKDFF